MRPHLSDGLCRLIQEAYHSQRIVSTTPSQAADLAVVLAVVRRALASLVPTASGTIRTP